MTDEKAKMLLEAGLLFEFFLSVPSLLVNVYFALRFGQSECFSENLRVLLVSSNIITALCSLLHPLVQIVPPEWYAVESGRLSAVLVAFLVYGANFLMMILLMIVNSKFLMVGVERWIAFKQRADYEQRDGSGARRVLLYYVIVVTILSAIKSAVMFGTSTEESLDERLTWTFRPERCVWLFTPLTFFAGLTWIVGVAQFSYLSHYVKKYKYHGNTLSERFQLKQTAQVVEVMIPLLAAYAVGVTYSGCCMLLLLFRYFVQGFTTNTPQYILCANAAYYSIPAYSLYSTIYMLYYFRPIRRLMFADIKRVCGMECWKAGSVNPETQVHENEGQVYFDQLRLSWA